MKRFLIISIGLGLVLGWGVTLNARKPQEGLTKGLKVSHLRYEAEGVVHVVISSKDVPTVHFPLRCLHNDLDENYECGPDQKWGCYQGTWVFQLKEIESHYEATLQTIHRALNQATPVSVTVSEDCNLLSLTLDGVTP